MLAISIIQESYPPNQRRTGTPLCHTYLQNAREENPVGMQKIPSQQFHAKGLHCFPSAGNTGHVSMLSNHHDETSLELPSKLGKGWMGSTNVRLAIQNGGQTYGRIDVFLASDQLRERRELWPQKLRWRLPERASLREHMTSFLAADLRGCRWGRRERLTGLPCRLLACKI